MICPLCHADDVAPSLYTRRGFELARCRACGVAFVTEQPDPADLAERYSFAVGFHVGFRDDEREIANRFAIARRQYEMLSRHCATGRCLDVGASAGFFVKTAADRGWDAHGVELSEDTSRLARERYGVDVLNARLEDVSFPPESFDAITLWDVIEHLPDPLDTVRRIASLLRPHGVLGILTPNLDGLFARGSYRIGRRLGHWPAVDPPGHLFQFSLAGLKSLLEREGFEIVQVEHEIVPMRFVFGGPRELLRRPTHLAYALAFAPLMWLGPRVRAGDQIVVFARKRPPVS